MKHGSASRRRIQLLALDLDDTLLDTKLSISEGNKRAIYAAERLGVQVVLASGRSPEALLPYASFLGMDQREGYLICFNGSLILRSDTGNEEWGVKLDAGLVADIWDLAASVGSAIQTYLPNEIIYNVPNKYTELDHQITGMPLRQVGRDEFVASARVKINLPGEPEFLSSIEGTFLQRFSGRANMFRTKPFYFELVHPEADKGLALQKLATGHAIARDEVMAIGDAMNDAGMLRWAGISVAMANALPEVKDISSWTTTKSNDLDGVAEAIERFILHGNT